MQSDAIVASALRKRASFGPDQKALGIIQALQHFVISHQWLLTARAPHDSPVAYRVFIPELAYSSLKLLPSLLPLCSISYLLFLPSFFLTAVTFSDILFWCFWILFLLHSLGIFSLQSLMYEHFCCLQFLFSSPLIYFFLISFYVGFSYLHHLLQ